MVNYTPKLARDVKDSPISPDKTVVNDLAIKTFVPLSVSDSIVDAQEKILKQRLPGAPVVNERGEAIGFLSERDCLVRVMKMKYHNEVSNRIVDFMSPKCFTVHENDSISKAIDLFSNNFFIILPVVSDSNRITGILSRSAVFQYVVGLKQQSW